MVMEWERVKEMLDSFRKKRKISIKKITIIIRKSRMIFNLKHSLLLKNLHLREERNQAKEKGNDIIIFNFQINFK